MPEKRELTYVGAIAEAVSTVLAEQPTAFVAGEDVAGAGGRFRFLSRSVRRVWT